MSYPSNIPEGFRIIGSISRPKRHDPIICAVGENLALVDINDKQVQISGTVVIAIRDGFTLFERIGYSSAISDAEAKAGFYVDCGPDFKLIREIGPAPYGYEWCVHNYRDIIDLKSQRVSAWGSKKDLWENGFFLCSITRRYYRRSECVLMFDEVEIANNLLYAKQGAEMVSLTDIGRIMLKQKFQKTS